MVVKTKKGYTKENEKIGYKTKPHNKLANKLHSLDDDVGADLRTIIRCCSCRAQKIELQMFLDASIDY